MKTASLASEVYRPLSMSIRGLYRYPQFAFEKVWADALQSLALGVRNVVKIIPQTC